MEPAINVEDLSFGYDEKFLILKQVSFLISAGEYVGIIGPNGGGKTTLLKLMLGFLKPLTGSISIFGQAPKQSFKQISYVPQAMQYDRQFPISVLELVLSGRLSRLPWYGQFSKPDRQIALNAIQRVGLKGFENHSFGNLSGGQAQRALIARALVAEPQLLLLDEPTASVDTQAEADIYALLRELHQDGITILMVTHDLKTAVDQVEKVICVQGNCILLKPAEVCEHFALGLYHTPLIQVEKEHLQFPRGNSTKKRE